MGKLIGTLLILGGCAGALWNWWNTQRKKQAVIAEWICFLARWEYSLEREKTRLYDFLQHYECRQPQVEKVVTELLAALQAREYQSGKEAWRRIMEINKRKLYVGARVWEILLTAEDAFFGTSSRESLRCVIACRKRLEEELGEEREEFQRRQKVYIPVGMLAGVLLIILLI